jgi:hypothetical protein
MLDSDSDSENSDNKIFEETGTGKTKTIAAQLYIVHQRPTHHITTSNNLFMVFMKISNKGHKQKNKNFFT